MIDLRDLCVLLLLDVSGSTAERHEKQQRVLDVEKQATVILGEGLSTLDDRFAVCGFSSGGREQVDFLTFKDFDMPWNRDAINAILSVAPRNSTRIGPALRHAGYLLGGQPHRQRLILLITDGKPMDDGYDPRTGYAQHDVRMACEENRRRSIFTFAVSTEDNSQSDMELMFPERRFVILPDIDRLVRLLPELYLRLSL
jgi:nitric oxide reductase activation protein